MNKIIIPVSSQEQANILLMTNACVEGFDSIYRGKAQEINKTWEINKDTYLNSLELVPECFWNSFISFRFNQLGYGRSGYNSKH